MHTLLYYATADRNGTTVEENKSARAVSVDMLGYGDGKTGEAMNSFDSEEDIVVVVIFKQKRTR